MGVGDLDRWRAAVADDTIRPAFVAWCAERLEAFGRVHRWLVDHAA